MPPASPTWTPNRRQLLRGAALSTLAGPLAACAGGPERRPQGARAARPNVLFVLTDQQRFDSAGFMGNALARTPGLDALAASGVVLEKVYCQAPLCVPARQSLITGRYPHEHGSFDNAAAVFPADQRTIAHDFAEAGYATAMIGKSHFNDTGFAHRVTKADLKRSFFELHPDAVLPEHRLKAESPPRFTHKASLCNPLMLPPGDGERPVFYMEEGVVAEARRFLEELPAERPFLLWTSFVSPHPPFTPPEPFLAPFRDAELPVPAPADDAVRGALRAADRARSRSQGVAQLTAEDRAGMVRSYYANVAWADHNVAELLAALEESGRARDTLVVFTSDHGELLGQHGMIAKGSFFEGSVRVPAILRFPGGGGGPSRFSGLVEHRDLAATVTRWAGLELAGGRDLAPWIAARGADEPPAWSDRVFSETYDGRSNPALRSTNVGQMVREGDFKLFRYRSGDEVLYDVEADPTEAVDLFEAPQHRALREHLVAQLDSRLPDVVAVN